MDAVKAKKTALDVMRSYIILKNYMKEHSAPVGVPMWSSSRSIEGLSDYILQTDNLDLYNVAYRDMDYSFLVDCSISLFDEIFKSNIDRSDDNDPVIHAYHSINAMCRTYVTLTDWFVRSGKMLKDQQAGNGRASEAQNLNPKPQQGIKELLPEKLKTEEAVEIFKKAIDAKLIDYSPEGLRWKDTKQLLAYFAEKLSNKFRLTTKLDKDGVQTVSWNPFEKLFGEKDLKGAKQNWTRLNTKFTPTGFEKVDTIF